jgi:RimJ/RimL family protein N-acetyltransferase
MRAVEDHSGQMIGLCGLFPRASKKAELAYMVKFEFQRKGFGREAVSAIVDQAHAAGLEVFATIRPGNSASQKVAEAAGLVKSSTRLANSPELDVYCHHLR